MKDQTSKFLVSLSHLKERAEKGSMTLQELVELLGEQSHHILIIIFCIPYLQPIPFPGLSSIFALVIIILSFFLLLQRPPWFPTKIQKFEFKQEILLRLLTASQNVWKKIGKIIHTRLSFVFKIPGAKTADFLMVLVSSLLLSLPLPIPFSNLIPTLPIFFNSLGHLEEDGFLVIFSYILFILNILFFMSLGAGIFSGAELLLQKFSGH